MIVSVYGRRKTLLKKEKVYVQVLKRLLWWIYCGRVPVCLVHGVSNHGAAQ